MDTSAAAPHNLTIYNRAAEQSARGIMTLYSTSFTLASRMLGARKRTQIAMIYALVRLTDEVVDGAAEQAGLGDEERRLRLDALETETCLALESGYSSNPVVHVFAGVARTVGFGEELTQPFFASMRADLTKREYSEQELADYIYGSAEVIGLMCLAVFIHETAYTQDQRAELHSGARALGAAFQRINFLRDLAADYYELGRAYFPGVSPEEFGEEQKHRILDQIEHELRLARSTLPMLPRDSRPAVAAACALFTELTRRISEVPATQLVRHRVSVPGAVKLAVIVRAAAGSLFVSATNAKGVRA